MNLPLDIDVRAIESVTSVIQVGTSTLANASALDIVKYLASFVATFEFVTTASIKQIADVRIDGGALGAARDRAVDDRPRSAVAVRPGGDRIGVPAGAMKPYGMLES